VVVLLEWKKLFVSSPYMVTGRLFSDVLDY